MDSIPEYKVLHDKAKLQYDSAFHLLHGTYSFVNDPKLLIGISMNLFNSMEKAMEAVLAYEHELKLLPAYSSTFTGKFDLFKRKSAVRHQIPVEYVKLMSLLQETVDLHRKSPVEFSRGPRFVICNDNYNLKAISSKDLQNYLQKTKEFLTLTGAIISNLERKE